MAREWTSLKHKLFGKASRKRHYNGRTPSHDAAQPVREEATAAKSSSSYTVHSRILANAAWYQEGLETDDDQMLRLLYLQPGSADDPIEGSLERVSLKDAPRYDALSYSWGVYNEWREITIDQKPGFAVTLTLWQALHRLRSSTATRALWIDALCINQDHTAERNSQVLNMGNIFSSARLVVAWLGESEDIKEEQNLLQTCTEHDRFLAQLASANPDKTRAWWNRVWVLQEVAMAKDLMVYFGPYVLSWSDLFDIADGRSEWEPLINLRDIRATVRLLGTDRPVGLLQILSQSGYCYSSDPLDTIFGLCGMTSRDQLSRAGLLPDYSMSPDKLLLLLAKYMASSSPSEVSVDVLNELGLDQRNYTLILLQNWLLQTGHIQLTRLLDASTLTMRIPKRAAHIFIAARHNHDVAIRSLATTHRLGINLTDSTGKSVLHWAVMVGSKEAVQELLRFQSIEANVADDKGRTPLSYAVATGNIDIVQIMTDSGKVKNASAQVSEADTDYLVGIMGRAGMEAFLRKQGLLRLIYNEEYWLDNYDETY